MLYYLSSYLTEFWGPFRLLQSHVFLLAFGTVLAGLLTLFLLPKFFRFLPSEKRVEVFTVMAGEDVLCTRAKFLEEHHRFSFELE